jgi:hypothetical protein
LRQEKKEFLEEIVPVWKRKSAEREASVKVVLND